MRIIIIIIANIIIIFIKHLLSAASMLSDSVVLP